MPWQPADKGTIAQNDAGDYQVNVGGKWIPAPKGSIAKNDAGDFQMNTDALVPPPPEKVDTPQPTGIGTKLGHFAQDMGGTVARGVGTAVGIAKNVGHMVNGEPTEDPTETGDQYAHAAPFQHDPDIEPDTAYNRAMKGSKTLGEDVLSDKHVQAAMDTNGGRLVSDIVHPVADLVNAYTVAKGAKDIGGGIVKAGASAADTGINALNQNTPAQADRVGANQQLVRARADGFKATADDVRSKTNPADTSAPNADLPGPSSTTPDVADKVNVHNQALATRTMAEDVHLPNTRNINPDEINERMSQEGKVYDQVGEAIGPGRTPTPALDHDIAASSTKSADPEVQAKIDKRVQFYRDSFKDGFDGPQAVQTVRTLRNDATARMLSDDPGEQAMGKTHQAIADAIEDEMMRQLPASAQDLHNDFPTARQQLAKLFELRDVTEGGQVNPAKVLQLKNGGKPLTGAADSVANAAEVLPQSMQGPAGSPTQIKTAPTPGRGIAIDAWNLAKAGIHKLPGMNPTTDAYQVAHYGEVGGSNATPPASSAPRVSPIRPPVTVTPPAGDVGALKRQTQMPLPPGPEGPPPAELTPPPGPVIEPSQRSLNLPEPVTRTKAGEPLMTREEWEAQAKTALKRRGSK